MNALYVTVSIPLLLVLAGFNHAYGLTTFGKTPSNNNQTPQPSGQGKTCSNHTMCRAIQGTSCVYEPRDHSRKSCLCGDNNAPVNGICTAHKKGPHHLCTDAQQCVEGAECKPMRNGSPGQEVDRVCECMPGFVATLHQCNGGTATSILSGLIVLLVIASRAL